jgi:hypothetical protein
MEWWWDSQYDERRPVEFKKREAPSKPVTTGYRSPAGRPWERRREIVRIYLGPQQALRC